MYYNVKPVLFSMNPCVNILDNISPEIDTIHFYIDLKNSSTMLFIEDYLQEIVYNTKKMNKPDSSILQSLLYTIYQWKQFFKSKNLKYKIFFCNDYGESTYHTEIYKDYKSNRKYRKNIFLQEIAEDVENIKHANWKLAKMIINSSDDTYFMELQNLESDFIPYYLITRKYNKMNNIYHIISSSDKDHYQILNIPNTVMFSRRSNETTIYDKNTYLSKYIKPSKNTKNINTQSQYIELMSKFNPDYINILMSFCGDSSDSIPGLPKIGEKTAIKMLTNHDITSVLLGNINDIEQRIFDGQLLLNKCSKTFYETLDSNWKLAYDYNKLVTNSYKMISYESLCKNLEKQNSENKRENLKILNDFEQKTNFNSIEKKQKILESVLSIQDCNLDNTVINCVLN